MGKGDTTRTTILADAVELASVRGLEGLSIGALAERTTMSKSGLFAHFGSKERLQLATLEAAVAQFIEAVITPALRTPRGRRRLEVLFERWLAWSGDSGPPGGCPFVAASFEMDDREGPVRTYLVEQQTAWLALLAETVAKAVGTGDLRPDVDSQQFAHELNGIFLMYQQARRLLRDPAADDRARRAFTRLMEQARDADTA